MVIFVDDVSRDFAVNDLLEDGLSGGRSGGCGGLRLGLLVGHGRLENKANLHVKNFKDHYSSMTHNIKAIGSEMCNDTVNSLLQG